MDENQNPEETGKFNPLVLVAVLVIVVIGAGAYFMTRSKPAVEGATNETPVSQEPTTPVEPTSVQETSTIQIEGGSFYFKPNEIKVKVNQPVKIVLTSVGGMPHDFVIDELGVKTAQVKDSQVEVTFTPTKTGSFEFYCSVGRHRAMGMKGTLIVE